MAEKDIEITVTLRIPVRPEYKDGKLAAVFTNHSLEEGKSLCYRGGFYLIGKAEDYDKWSRYPVMLVEEAKFGKEECIGARPEFDGNGFLIAINTKDVFREKEVINHNGQNYEILPGEPYREWDNSEATRYPVKRV